MVPLSDLRLDLARARIAEAAAAASPPVVLGSIALRPHQRVAVARATQCLARHGGCLLADDVGRGKTYVALAVARQWERPLVVIPSSLRTTWQRAMQRARVSCTLVTHEALSRGALPAFEPDGVIVDESHRFRSPDAKRHAALALVTAYAPVLLLSATPLQNGTRDLAAQLALFLGSWAFRATESMLARFVVRGARGAGAGDLPQVAPPAWMHPSQDDGAVLRAILALPPPARAFDAGDAGVLRTIGLVRAWASSRAALLAALRQRMRIVTALEQCAANGLSPGRRDLRLWHGVGGDIQLALAPLLVSRTDGGSGRGLFAAADAERVGIERLTAVLRRSADPDDARIAAIRALRAEHPDARILAFSEFATTVRAYFALLRADAGVGMLTASEARIASGRLPRDELLDRFAPAAQGAPDPAPRERVTLLLSTDLLSEGVNLQDASIVVHLDLPWNPARLAQRLGRIRRPGGASVVHSFLMAPPATTELLLRVDARLRTKLARAERAIGRALPVLPALSASVPGAGAEVPSGAADPGVSAEALATVADEVASWRWSARAPGRSCSRDTGRETCFAAVTSDHPGWLAAFDDGSLLARCDGGRPDVSRSVVRAVTLASGASRPVVAAEQVSALAEARAWLERQRVSRECGVAEDASLVDGALERCIARAVNRAPRHRRANLLVLGARLRDLLGQPRSLGAERELARLMTVHSEASSDDAAWLECCLAVAARSARRAVAPQASRIVALIVFGPGDPAPDAAHAQLTT